MKKQSFSAAADFISYAGEIREMTGDAGLTLNNVLEGRSR